VKPVIAALVFLGAAACVTSGSPVDSRLEYTYNSSVNGVIVMPAAADTGCDGLNVVALVGEQPVGRTSIHASKNRCTYQIDNVPSDREVTVKVQPASDLKCQDGSPVAFVSDVQGPLKIQPQQGALQDFRAQCGATKS